jgi:hypothetical protein
MLCIVCIAIEIAKQKLRPSIMKIKPWRHRQHGKTFVNGMNALFNFRKWNTNDDLDTKVAAGSQDNTRNLGKQTAAILYVYYNILNWFSEDELCTLLGYAFRNHNVKQAVHRMVKRDMLISQNDSAGIEEYYLSKVSLEFSGRSPEDNPDIEKTNPTYAETSEIRKKEGLTLINSRKQLKPSLSQAAATTPQTGAASVAEAETKANRTLDFNPKKSPILASAVTDAEATAAAALSPPSKRKPERALKSNFKKRAKTTASTATTSSTAASDTLNDKFPATPSNSLESDEEPPTKTIDLSQSSPSDSSDSEDTDSEDTTEEFEQIIPEARKKGTDFNNARAV